MHLPPQQKIKEKWYKPEAICTWNSLNADLFQGVPHLYSFGVYPLSNPFKPKHPQSTGKGAYLPYSARQKAYTKIVGRTKKKAQEMSLGFWRSDHFIKFFSQSLNDPFL